MRPRNPARRPPTKFNMTPLIDMVFTLMIFFMLTMQIEREMATKVKLPKADQADQVDEMPPRSLLVLVGSDGTIFVNGQAKSLGDFEVDLLSWSPEEVPEQLVLRGDGGVDYRIVQGVMRAASSVGITKVEITASRESEDLS